MRYTRIVTFWSDDKPTLNTETGEYEGESKMIATMIANVTQTGIQRTVATFGDVDQDSLTIRTIDTPPASWAYLTLDGDDRHYRQNISVSYQPTRHTLIVGEEA